MMSSILTDAVAFGSEWYFAYINICILFQQMQWPSVEPILVLAVVQSTWTMLAALAVRLDSLTVPEALLSTVDMATQRMLEYDAKVWRNTDTLICYM